MSKKEKLILLANEGMTDLEIAKFLNLSVNTTRAYRVKAGIFRNSGAHKIGQSRKISKTGRKGNSMHITITGEAQLLGWTPKDGITVIADRDNERLIIKRIRTGAQNASL
jgi:hypothetical protein